MYYLVLAILFLTFIQTWDILLNINQILSARLSEAADGSILHEVILIYLSVVADFIISWSMVINGVVANFTLKLDWYKTHRTSIVISISSGLLMLYTDFGYIIVLGIRVLSWVYLQMLVSQIYSGAVYHLFKGIQNDYVRSRLEIEFNKLNEREADSLTSYTSMSTLFYSGTVPEL